MDLSPRIGLAYLAPQQAQKHVTVNEALRRLDAVAQLAVNAAAVTAEPETPAEGDIYILPEGATGDAWSAMSEGSLAAFQDGAWVEIAPGAGWRAWVIDAGELCVFDGAAWSAITAGGGGSSATLGVNATADSTNRLAVKSDAALFSHDDVTPGTGDMRLVVNKSAEAGSASVIFQTGFSGRAEFGLPGNDDWTVKVSPDGAAWTEALRVANADGRVLLPAGLALTDPDQAVAKRHVRERLSAPRTYYVRTDGDDGNDGLSNASGGAFLTIGKAVSVAYGDLDLGSHDVTIQLGDGTYNESVVVAANPVGTGRVIIQGNVSAPGDTVIQSSGGVGAVEARGGAVCVKALRVDGGAAGLYATPGGIVYVLDGVQFGAATTGQMWAAGGVIDANISGSSSGSSYSIVASAARHFRVNNGGCINARGVSVTLTGTPAFSSAYAGISTTGFLWARDSAFSGSATGKRYDADTNAVIDTNGGGASYFPGNSAGSAASGGQYV